MQKEANPVMFVHRIVIEKVDDNNRTYHVNTRLVSGKLVTHRRGESWLRREGAMFNEPEIIKDALAFYAIDGVENVELDIYKISIKLSPAFRWDKVETFVIGVIKILNHWEEQEVEVVEL
jgi:hypothetical protein